MSPSAASPPAKSTARHLGSNPYLNSYRGPGYADVGAEAILVPAAIDHGGSYVPEVLVRAGAAENGITIAYANHAGTSA